MPIPSLALALSVQVAGTRRRGEWLLSNEWGVQLATWVLERAIRAARVKVPGLPPNFRYDDLRHASAKIALDTCGHLWPDSEDSTRAAVGAVLEAHAQNSAEILADCSTDC